jgi:hypothetical protein
MARLVVYVEIPLNSATVQKDIDKLAKVVGKSAYHTSVEFLFHADRQEADALAARLTRHGYKIMFEVDENEPDA